MRSLRSLERTRYDHLTCAPLSSRFSAVPARCRLQRRRIPMLRSRSTEIKRGSIRSGSAVRVSVLRASRSVDAARCSSAADRSDGVLAWRCRGRADDADRYRCRHGTRRTSSALDGEQQRHRPQCGCREQLAAGGVPAELVPLIVRRRWSLCRSRVLAGAQLRWRSRSHRSCRARSARPLDSHSMPGRSAEATIDQAVDGMPARVVDGEGVIALRISAAQARIPFAPTDLVAATAVPINGKHHAHHLILDGNIVLPALPGQAATIASTGVAIDLDAQLPGNLPAADIGRDRANEIRTLVAGVRARITPDLGAAATSATDAELRLLATARRLHSHTPRSHPPRHPHGTLSPDFASMAIASFVIAGRSRGPAVRGSPSTLRSAPSQPVEISSVSRCTTPTMLAWSPAKPHSRRSAPRAGISCTACPQRTPHRRFVEIVADQHEAR